MPYGTRESGRIPNSAHRSHPWRIHELVPDFTLEDVWALPVHGGAEDFPAMLETFASLDPADGDSRATRFLWDLRDSLGRWFGLGRVHLEPGEKIGVPEFSPPGCGKDRYASDGGSLAGRLPDELRGTAADADFGSLPFVPLYRTAYEAAAEISNRTVHGVAHLAWVAEGGGRFQGQLAVYVKPRGRLGQAYMALIKPFRYAIVYPAMLRHLGRAWDSRRC